MNMNNIKTFTIRDFNCRPTKVILDMSMVRRIWYRESFGDEILKIEYKNGTVVIADSYHGHRSQEEGEWRVIYDMQFAKLME